MWAPWLVAVDASVGTATVLAGLLAWTARPDSRAGPALVGIGGLWFLGAFGYGTDMALVDFVGFPLQGWHDALLIALLLAVTPGGLRERRRAGDRRRRRRRRTRSSHWRGCCCGRRSTSPAACASCNRITGVTDPGAYETTVRVASLAEAALLGRGARRSSRSAGGVRAAPPATRSRRCSVRRSRRPRS